MKFKVWHGCDRGLCHKGCGRQNHQLNTFDWLADVPGNNQTTDLVEVQFKNTRKGYYHNVNNLDLKKGDIVVYESTVYPGATEEVCVPILEEVSGLKFNQDFFAGYSPERINPGDKVNTLTTIKKIISGSTPEIADIVDAVYASIITAGTHQSFQH